MHVLTQTQYHDFLEPELGRLPIWRMDRVQLEKGLANKLKKALAAAETARKRIDKAHAAANKASQEAFRCEQKTCPDRKTLQRKADELAKRTVQVLGQEKERQRELVLVFKKALEHKPTASVAVALGWLTEQGTLMDMPSISEHPAEKLPKLGRFKAAYDSYATEGARQAYQRAIALSRPGDRTGLYARYTLAIYHWMQGDIEKARPALQGLIETALDANRKAELHLRLGVLASAAKPPDWAGAARHFEQAKGMAKGKLVQQATRAWIVAELRARHFKQALQAALGLLDSMLTPKSTKTKSGKNRFGILAKNQLASLGGNNLDLPVRIAADCLERLQPRPLPQANSATWAAIKAELSVRALYRGDEKHARLLAQQSLDQASSPAKVASAVKVLAALAERAGDKSQAEALRAKLSPWQLKRTGGFSGLGLGLHPPMEIRRDRDLFGNKGDGAAKATEKQVATRSLGALVRLCSEPEYWRIAGFGREQKKRLLVLEADLSQDTDQARVRLPSRDPDEGLDGIVTCLTQLGPALLAGSPMSIKAELDFSRLTRLPSSNLAKTNFRTGKFSSIAGLIGKQAGVGSARGRGYGRSSGGLGRLRGSASTRKKTKPTPKIKASLGQGRMQGTCDQQAVTDVLKRRLSLASMCMVRLAQKGKTLRPVQVKLSWTIGEHGRASRSKLVSSSPPTPSMSACLERFVKRLRFPKPTQGSCEMEWEIQLTPEGG